MIEFSHIYKTYPGPTHALRDVNLKIDKGEFAFLTGPSGAGKTTLFKIMSAFDVPDSGHLSIAGKDLRAIKKNELPEYRRRIGVVYQDFRLINRQTVFENVALPLEIRGDRPAFIADRVGQILEEVGLYHKKDKFPPQLSGGEQQRVSIARALIHQPGILIADEPTGNLDPHLSKEIIGILDKINAQGTTVFVATHDLELVKSLNRRNVEIKNGQVISGGQA